jgi:hypothetical protein
MSKLPHFSAGWRRAPNVRSGSRRAAKTLGKDPRTEQGCLAQNYAQNGQIRGNGELHSMQNLAPSRGVAPQLGQSMWHLIVGEERNTTETSDAALVLNKRR